VLCTTCPALGQDRMAQLQAQLEDETSPYVMVAAHRGGHRGQFAHIPENSIAAIEAAIEIGADIVELDVRVTADGVAILLHDQTLDRTTSGQGDVEQRSWAYVSGLRLKPGEPGHVSAEHPPSLEAALRATQGRILVDLDMKTDQVDVVMAVVHQLDMNDEVVWFDSDLAVLDQAQSLDASTQMMPRAYEESDLAALCARYTHLPVIHIDRNFNTSRVHAAIRDCGARAWINALGEVDQLVISGDVASLEALIGSGASIVQSDYPGQLIETLEEMGHRDGP